MTTGTFVLGLLNGLMYGLLGIGVVLVYNSSRFINLAHAQLGVLSAQLLALLSVRWGWGWWTGVAVCLPVGIAVAIGVELLVIRPLRRRRTSAVGLLLASVGISQILIGLSTLPNLQPDPTTLVQQGYPLPFSSTVEVGGVVLNGASILVAVLAPIVVIGLMTFLRWTTLGKIIRAAASNPDAARLCGVSVGRVSTITWAVAGGLASITAILQAPSQGAFNANALGPQLLLLGLGAAAAGAFTSIGWAMAGGLAIGILYQQALAATSDAGTANLYVTALILLIVLVRARSIGRRFVGSGGVVADLPPVRVPPSLQARPLMRRRRPIASGCALVAATSLAWLPPLSSPSDWFELSLIAIYALIALSLTVLVGWGGQVSLGHFALVGAGALVGGRVLDSGWPVVGAVLVAGTTGAVILCLVGLPSLRVPGLTLPVTTLGLALISPEWLFRQTWFGTDRASGIILGDAELLPGAVTLGTGRAVYLVVLATIALTAVALHAMRQSPLGRTVIAVRDNQPAASALGVAPVTSKLFVMAVSGFIAATAGVLWALSWRSVAPQQFDPSLSLAFVALPLIGGLGSVNGAIAGGSLFYAAALYVSPHVQGLFGSLGGDLGFITFLGGVSTVGFLLQLPQGLAGKARSVWQSVLDRGARDDTLPPPVPARPTIARLLVSSESRPLDVRNVTVEFGGVIALDDVSLHLDRGEIVGIIGSNGSGKSTLLNVVSGHQRARSGSVHLSGAEITGRSPASRAADGLGRTFQHAGLFAGLTVNETLEAATIPRGRAGIAWLTSRSSWRPGAESTRRAAADSLAAELGLGPWSHTLTAELSTGTRRICDLAAQLARRSSVLLLDEPTAGVAQRDAEAFGPLVRRLRDTLGCAILLVEHDMPLLMSVCDRVYALEAGRIIASGSPDEVRRNPAVIASYLGTDEVAISRSG